MSTEKANGIVLSSRNLFEKDRLIHVFSPTQGVLKILMKNANTKKFKYGSSIDPITISEFILYKGKQFLYCYHCTTRQSFPKIREDFNKLSLSLYFIDIIQKSTSMEQPNPHLFQLLYQTLTQLETSYPLPNIQTEFHQQFLLAEGLLATTQKQISNAEFTQIFQSYSGKSLKQPMTIQS